MYTFHRKWLLFHTPNVQTLGLSDLLKRWDELAVEGICSGYFDRQFELKETSYTST